MSKKVSTSVARGPATRILLRALSALHEFRGGLAAFFIAAAITVRLYDLNAFSLRRPISYSGSGDEMWIMDLLRQVAEDGWVFTSAREGAPFTAIRYDYPIAEPLQFGVLRVLSLFGLGGYELFNVLTLLPFPLTALTMYWACRRMDVSRSLAVLMGVVYTFLPFHIMRAVGHTLLASYWIVPLSMTVALQVAQGERVFFGVKSRFRLTFPRPGARELGMLLIVLATGMVGGGYWQFFSAALLGFSGIVGALRKRALAPLVDGFASAMMVGAMLALSLLPNTLYTRAHGAVAVDPRVPNEAEYYGLKIGQMLAPSDWHRWAPMHALAKKYDDGVTLLNENHMSALGVFGSIAFIVMLLVLFCPADLLLEKVPDGDAAARDQADRALSRLQATSQMGLATVLFGTVGGFGALFAIYVSPTIRGYNRLSIYVVFFALVALALFFQRFVKVRSGRAQVRFSAALVAVGGLAVLDQTPQLNYATTQKTYQQIDAEFVSRIEAKLPPAAMVYQLPYVPMPDAGKQGLTFGNSFLQGVLNSKKLRWSFGDYTGREGDAWHQRLMRLPVNEMLDTLSYTGFSAVWLGLRGYPDMSRQMRADLTERLGPPFEASENKEIIVFDLQPYAAALRARMTEAEWASARARALTPVTLSFVTGCHEEEHDENANRDWRWCTPNVLLRVMNPAAAPQKMRFHTLLAGGAGTVTFEGVLSRSVELHGQVPLDFEVTVPPGTHEVHVHSTGPNVAPKTDTRDLRFLMENWALESVR